MKYILFLALLPCLTFAGKQIGSVPCPDDTECEFGKTCCLSENGQDYQCCDLPEEDLKNEKLVLAVRSSSAQHVSFMASPRDRLKRGYCYGTACARNNCCNNMYNATCCNNPKFCCPGGARCCSTSFNAAPWCCPMGQFCHSTYGYCTH